LITKSQYGRDNDNGDVCFEIIRYYSFVNILFSEVIRFALVASYAVEEEEDRSLENQLKHQRVPELDNNNYTTATVTTRITTTCTSIIRRPTRNTTTSKITTTYSSIKRPNKTTTTATTTTTRPRITSSCTSIRPPTITATTK
jgi:hypothetical protein